MRVMVMVRFSDFDRLNGESFFGKVWCYIFIVINGIFIEEEFIKIFC